jgi:hypothetical protein
MFVLVLSMHIPVQLILVASGPDGTRCHTATVKSIDPDEDVDHLPSVSSSIVGTLCWFNQYDQCCSGSLLTRDDPHGPMAARRSPHDQTLARRSRSRPARRYSARFEDLLISA